MTTRTATRVATLAASFAIGSSASASADGPRSFDFPIPDVGMEFFFGSGGIPGASDYAGNLVTGGRVSLKVTITEIPGQPGISDASNFYTEIILPVDTNLFTPEIEPYYAYISGADEGWSGLGTFTIEREIPQVAGSTFAVPFFFTATTYNDGVNGTISFAESFWEIDVVPAPGPVAMLGLAGAVALRRRR